MIHLNNCLDPFNDIFIYKLVKKVENINSIQNAQGFSNELILNKMILLILPQEDAPKLL